MNLLCLDIGNTSITVCKSSKAKLGKLTRIPSSDHFTDTLSNYDLELIESIIVCSVVPELTEILTNYCKLNSIDLFVINHKNSNLNLLVDDPSEVGNDRICNIVAANKHYKSASIIIDFGTATTYDVINEKGDFIGGAIAPGIDISADYLIQKTAQLKNTIYKFPDNVIGTNTTTNIQSGVMMGGLESVKGMIKLIKKEISNPNPNIIITGGFGLLISNALEVEHVYKETLTIEGMLEIFFATSIN